MKLYNKPVINVAEVEDVITTSMFFANDADASSAFQKYIASNTDLNLNEEGKIEGLVFEW